MEDTRSVYDKFMEEYGELHDTCPKCGHDLCRTTLQGFVFHHDAPGDYKDLNVCVCTKCGDRHTMHDRHPSNDYITVQINQLLADVFRPKDMIDTEWETSIKLILSAGGMNMERMVEDVRTGLRNGYSIEKQFEILKTVLGKGKETEIKEPPCQHRTQDRVRTHRGTHCGNCGKRF